MQQPRQHEEQQQPAPTSWEVDHMQACRRGYHLLRIPCEEYHRLLAEQQIQSQLHQQQQQQQQQQSHQQQVYWKPQIDHLTSYTIKTPVSGLSGARGDKESQHTQQHNYQQQQHLQHHLQQQHLHQQFQQRQQQQRHKRIVDPAIQARMRGILSEAGESEAGKEENETGSQDDEDATEKEEEEDEDEEETEVNEDDEEEDEDEEDEETANQRGCRGAVADQSEADIGSQGFEIVSDGGTNLTSTDDVIRAALAEDRAAASQSEAPCHFSRAQTLLAAPSADRVTSRSALRNSSGRTFCTGNTYSSEQMARHDTVMSRMQARQSELTRCVLEEQKKEQLMRQQQEMDPGVKEAVHRQRMAALQGLLTQREEHQNTEQLQQEQLIAMHDQLERWDSEVPVLLKGIDSGSVPPPPTFEPAVSGSRRRVQLTGLSGLCRERRPHVASRGMQPRQIPDPCSPPIMGLCPSVTQRLYTTEEPYNMNSEEAKLFRRLFSRALDPSVLPTKRGI